MYSIVTVLQTKINNKKGNTMFGLDNNKKIKNTPKQTKKVQKLSQASEAKAILAAMAKKKKDKPDDCVFC